MPIRNSSIHYTTKIWNRKLVNIYNSRVGEGTRIGVFVEIGGAIIGKFCKIQAFVFIPPGTVIGDYVMLGPASRLLNDKYPDLRAEPWENRAVKIRDGAIVGGGATILPGVEVGERAVVGSGSVVTRDIPAEECWVGSPAKFHMTREEYDLKRRLKVAVAQS